MAQIIGVLSQFGKHQSLLPARVLSDCLINQPVQTAGPKNQDLIMRLIDTLSLLRAAHIKTGRRTK